MYADESGDAGLPDNPLAKFKGSDYFVRVGIVVHDKKWHSVNARIRNFKISKRIPSHEELHAAEVISGKSKTSKKEKGKQKKIKKTNWYGEKYKNREDRLKILKDFLVSVFLGKNIVVFGVVIDKRNINLGLPKQNFNRQPKLKSLEFLSERFTHYIKRQTDKNGLIIMDSVNLKDDEVIRNFQKKLYAESKFIKAGNFIESILFCPSDSTNLLQLADVCSYAVYRKFFMKDNSLFEVFEGHFDKKNNNQIQGAGLKIWPQ